MLFISFSGYLCHWHLIWFIKIWHISIPEEQSWTGRTLTEQGSREVVLFSWHARNISQDFPLPTPTFSLPFLVCSNRCSSYQVNILTSMQALHLAVTDDYPKSFVIPPCYALCSIQFPCLHHFKRLNWINLHILGLCFFRDELWNSSPRIKLNHIFRFLSRLYYEFAALWCHPTPHLQKYL